MGLEETFATISQWFTDTFNLPDPLYGELIWSSIILVCFLILGWIVEHIFEHYFKKLAKKTKTKLDDEILKNVKKPIYALVIFFGLYFFIHNIYILLILNIFIYNSCYNHCNHCKHYHKAQSWVCCPGIQIIKPKHYSNI